MIVSQEPATKRWVGLFDSITARAGSLRVAVEAITDRVGDHVDVAQIPLRLNAKRLPLRAIVYDPAEGTLEIAVGACDARSRGVLHHLISDPRTIRIERPTRLGPPTLLVEDSDGVQTLIRLFSSDPPQPRYAEVASRPKQDWRSHATSAPRHRLGPAPQQRRPRRCG